MIVDGKGNFLTQRTHGRLALIETRIHGDNLLLQLDGEPVVPQWSEERKNCVVWNDKVDLEVCDSETSLALSDFLGEAVSLVRMDDESERRTSGTWAESDNSLSDGYPILITTTASLNALSATAGISLRQAQFRPNIVIQTEESWAEDHWKLIRIGGVELELVKPCTRCQVTTLDPINGERAYPETMEAMIKTRRSGDKRIKGVLFGWNAVVRSFGNLSVGDEVKVLETNSAWPVQ